MIIKKTKKTFGVASRYVAVLKASSPVLGKALKNKNLIIYDNKAVLNYRDLEAPSMIVGKNPTFLFQ